MVNYWKHQTLLDILLAGLISGTLWIAPRLGLPAFFTVDSENLIVTARTWLAPALTLLGMMSATTAFIFTVVDRAEFTVLRKSKSEQQLWQIFSENLLWLGSAAGYCAVVTFWVGGGLLFVATLGTLLVTLTVISVAKFVWIMRQIISVRMGQRRD